MNLRPESPERTQLISEICDRNLEILMNNYGEDSIYLLRPLYTSYTAKLHEESNEGSENALV
jgi:hypothetical protein